MNQRFPLNMEMLLRFIVFHHVYSILCEYTVLANISKIFHCVQILMNVMKSWIYRFALIFHGSEIFGNFANLE